MPVLKKTALDVLTLFRLEHLSPDLRSISGAGCSSLQKGIPVRRLP